MDGYTTEGRGEFFVAAAEATAALSGLIFVAVSVNIGAVLDEDKRSGGNFLIGPRAQAAACRPFMAPPGCGWRPLRRSTSLVVAGVTLAAGHGGGLFWIPVAFVLSIFVAPVNAWVLLVEVLR